MTLNDLKVIGDKIFNETTGTSFEPFINGYGTVGYICRSPEGQAELFYLNPSTSCTSGPADIFVYCDELEHDGGEIEVPYANALNWYGVLPGAADGTIQED